MQTSFDYLCAVDRLWHDMCYLLPNTPRDGCPYWTDNEEEILSESQDAVDRLADLFDDLYGEGTTTTGYYDSDEDRRNGETNRYTGFYYCSNC